MPHSKKPSSKIRLDKAVLEQFPTLTREKAQFVIMAGQVLVDDIKQDKCGTQVSTSATIRLLNDFPKYVSRGGNKIEGAFSEFDIDIAGKIAMDVGISTGGFTDYLFQNGIKSVFGIDVGYGQLDHKIRQNPNLFLLERTNARTYTPSDLEKATEKSPVFSEDRQHISLVVMDVSFISVTKVLPALIPFTLPETDFVILIKPQFEAERSEIGKGGIVKDPETQQLIINRVRETLSPLFTCVKTCFSPITGTKGNQEYFFWLKKK